MNADLFEHIFIGDSEMARLMRTHFAGAEAAAGSSMSLGTIAIWSQSFKTTLNILLNSCSPMFAVWGSDRLLFYNDAYCSLLRDQLQDDQPIRVGQPLSHSWNEDWQQMRSDVEQVFATGQPCRREDQPFPGDRPDPIHTYTWSYTPIWHEAGQLEGVFATGCRGVDQSAQSHPTSQDLKATLFRREEQLRLITNAIPALIAYVDKDHYYRFNNQTYETWFGQRPSDLMDRHVREVLGEAAYEAVLPHMKQALSGQRVSFESQIPYRRGGIRYISADYVPHINSQGVVEGYFSLVSDISDRKQTEAALVEQQQRYRYIFEAVSISIWEEDFSAVKAAIAQLKAAGVKDFQQYFSAHPEFVQQMIERVGLRDVNQATLRLFGAQSKAELLGSLRQIFTPEAEAIFVEELLAIATEQPFYAAETVLQTLRGDRFPVWFTIAFPPASEAYDRVLISLADISDRRQAEESVRQSEERYRYLAESIPQLVWTANAEGMLLDVNQRWIDFTGLTLKQAQLAGWQAIIHPDDVAGLNHHWEAAQHNNTHYQAEGRMRRFDGVYRWHLHQAVPLKDDEDEIIKWFGTATDIEEQKQLQQERERLLQREQAARAESETANRIKDEFLAVLSHELRSPLNPILGWSRLLQNGKLDPTRTQQALATIERNAKLQAELIEDLLDVSRILRGKLNLTISPVNLASTIPSAIETVRLAAAAKSIDLLFTRNLEAEAEGQSLKPEIQNSRLTILGDATRLQQIVWNLLSNAVKFTPPNGRVEVKLSSVIRRESSSEDKPSSPHDSEQRTSDPKPMMNYAQITVTDTGKGISPQFLPYVFDYFRQADSATTRQFGGLGLGLAIVRHLVELHGGTIQVNSPGEGMGTTFTIRLPLLKDENGGIKDEGQPFCSLCLNAQPLESIRVLLVEDNTDTRDFVAFTLEQAGAKVASVATAAAALAALKRSPPDILLSDIGLPEMDGYMLMRRIRALPPEQGGQVKAIALTAYAGDFNQQQALAAGFQRHLAKPIEPETLILAVSALTGTLPSRYHQDR
jgi:PAS domain S-box-containing protein